MQLPLEMRQAYLERRKVDVVLLEKACQKLEGTVLERVGHQLKGNALPFGFNELSILGNELEVASKNSDFKQAAILIKQIKTYIENYHFSDEANQ